LGSLAFITNSNSKETLQAAVSGPSGSNFVWAPIGRVSWDEQTRRGILDKWKHQQTTEELMRAGFAPADGEYLELALKSLDNLAGRMR